MSNDLNHPTLNKWTLWAHLPHDTDWTIESYKKIITISSIEEMITITETIPDVLVKNCMLFIMKENMNYIGSHCNNIGKDAHIAKNPLWVIQENGKEYILMYCEKDTLCKLCPDSYKKILEFEEKNEGKKITFFKGKNGYICSTIKLYIHQIITGCYGNGKGTKNISVDHIDRNPLNNTMENLRTATREEQEQNSKGIMVDTKRARKQSARELPEGITQDMMRKYVVYYKEWIYPEKVKTREYFKIEKHPNLEKIWIGTKSHSVSILDKLEQANKKINELDI
jgi:hypothetical protein